MPRIYIILLAACLICGCSKTELVEPISQEYNARFLTGKGLDPRYFSTKDVVQYYQVSGFEGLSSNTIFAKLDTFVNAHYKAGLTDSIESLNILFYRKKWLAGYNKLLYESARDNENRTLTGHSDDLVAWITYERLKGEPVKLIRSRSYFAQGKPPLEQRDTVILK